jgi:hypothetical protein
MTWKALAAAGLMGVALNGIAAADLGAVTIFVANDEWTLSNTGFASAGSTATFVTNLVAEMGPKIHAYTNNFGFTQSSLASAMSAAGATYTTGTAFAFTLANISGFDAIFLGGFALDDDGISALSSYVAAGGNVYIAGGTSTIAGGAAGEAAAWNGFLAPFGVQMAPTFNGLSGNIAVSGDPLFAGVTSLYQNSGNGLSGSSVICCSEGGLYAVYRADGNGGPGPSPIPLPAAGWILLTGLTGLAAVGHRRRI